MINQFEQMILPITEFRKNMTKILEKLTSPRIIMNRDKPQAVLVPYEIYKLMEEKLEEQMDMILSDIAAERIKESEADYITHDEFWKEMGIE